MDNPNIGRSPATPPPTSPIPYSTAMNDQLKAIDPLSTGTLITMPNFSDKFPRDPKTSDGTDGLASEDDSSSSDDEDSLLSTPCHSAGLRALKGLSSPEYQAARKAWVAGPRRRAPKKPKVALYGYVGGSMQGSLPLSKLNLTILLLSNICFYRDPAKKSLKSSHHRVQCGGPKI